MLQEVKYGFNLDYVDYIFVGLAIGVTELQGLFVAGNLRTEISGVFGGIESGNCKESDKSSNNFL